MCGDIELDDPAPDDRGMIDDYISKDYDVKDADVLLVAPSSVKCVFRRGVCQLHNVKGERQVQVSKTWKDRGGGKGYGYVTSKKVIFRFMVEKDVPRSSEWEGLGLVENDFGKKIN